jgi:eukaryotic-like serine/threonine-protein kinase
VTNSSPTKIGRYEIIERVGRGGMGAVYRGRDGVLDREVAIKVMSADFAADESSRPRFYREARAAAKLQHRNIVTIFEFGEEDETPFIVMEFLRGEDLSKRVRHEPPLTLEEKIDVLAELCTGLHFAHEQGVVHRDVKPANIWLVPDGSVKLLDFGIAKFSSSTMTRQGSVFGSIAYMSPEQVDGTDVDGRADIFAAGVVLYELLTGRKPFVGDSPTAVLARIMDDQPASTADLPADVPRPLVAALMKALEKDREKRYRHAGDMGADLRMVRSALTGTGDYAASAIDFAETRFNDSGSVRASESGLHHPAGTVPVARTITLDSPSPEATAPPRGPRRGRWLATLAAIVVVGISAGAWFLANGRGEVAAPSPAAAAARKLVRVESQPPGARIAVNDVDTGRVTPAEIEVDPAQLPMVTLKMTGRSSVTARLTSGDVSNASVLLRLESANPEKPAAPPAVAAAPEPAPPAKPVAPDPKVTVRMTGDYQFEVLEGGRVISPLSDSHEFAVARRARLSVRSPEHFLNQSIQLEEGREFTWQAPGLGRLDLRVREDCSVAIDGQEVGEPPLTRTSLAAGTHTAVATCPGQPPKRQTFTINAGQANPVTIR